MNKKILLFVLIVLMATLPLWMPATVFAITDQYDKLTYYLKALEYMYKGLIAYFEWIWRLFKLAVFGG